jgi:hypothetical protein
MSSKKKIVELPPRQERRPIAITIGEFVHGLRYRQRWVLRRRIEVYDNDLAVVTDTVDLNEMPSSQTPFPLNAEDLNVLFKLRE